MKTLFHLIILFGFSLAEAQEQTRQLPIPDYFQKTSAECKRWESHPLSAQLNGSCGAKLDPSTQKKFDQLAALKLHADLQKIYLEKAVDRIRQMSVTHKALGLPFPETPDLSKTGCRAAFKLGVDVRLKKLKSEFGRLELSEEEKRSLRRRHVAALLESELIQHQWIGGKNPKVMDRRDRLAAEFPQLYFSGKNGMNPLTSERRDAFLSLIRLLDGKLQKEGKLAPKGSQDIRINEYSVSRRQTSTFVDSQIFPGKGRALSTPPGLVSGKKDDLGDRLFELLAQTPDSEIPKEVWDYLKGTTERVSKEVPKLITNVCELENCMGDGKECDKSFCKLASLNKSNTSLMAFLETPALRESYSRNLCGLCAAEGPQWTDTAIIAGELVLNGAAAVSCLNANPLCAGLAPAAIAVNLAEAAKQVRDAIVAGGDLADSQAAAMAGIVSMSEVESKRSELYQKAFWAAFSVTGAGADYQLLKGAQESRAMAKALEMMFSKKLISVDRKGIELALKDPDVRKKLLNVANCKL